MSVPIVVRGGILVDNGVALGTDAFARVRTSNPTTMFQLMSTSYVTGVNSLQSYQVCESRSGTGTTSQDTDGSCINMTIAAPSGSCVRQSRLYVPYQPGKGKLVFMSGQLTSESLGVAGAVSRIGVFDDYSIAEARFGCGHYFELDGSDLFVVERNTRAGTTTNTSIARADWNGDKVDGTGPSGFDLQIDRMQLFWMDFEWLGVGMVRFGVIYQGQFVTCHTIYHTNTLEFTYTRTPKLPVRYEISGSVASSCTLKMVCSTIISEGGYVPKGIPMSFPLSLQATLPNNSTTITPVAILSLRTDDFASRSTILPRTFTFLIQDNKPVEFRVILYFNQTSTPNVTWTNVNSAFSMARYSQSFDASNNRGPLPVSNNSITLYNNITLGQTDSNLSFFGEQGYDGIPYLASSFTGVPDMIYIAARALVNTQPVVDVSIGWDEIQS
jgi:hypothetical protein